MATTLELFRVYYPAFAAVSDGDVSIYIGDVAAELVPARWRQLYQRAICALVAHLLEMRARSASAAGSGGSSAPGGALTSLKTGDLAVGYGSTSDIIANKGGIYDALYSDTVGGREYLRLRGRLYGGPVVVA
jgi:hypothetical protein